MGPKKRNTKPQLQLVIDIERSGRDDMRAAHPTVLRPSQDDLDAAHLMALIQRATPEQLHQLRRVADAFIQPAVGSA